MTTKPILAMLAIGSTLIAEIELSSVCAAPEYMMINLGSLDSGDDSVAIGINNREQIVGYSFPTNYSSPVRTFLYEKGFMQDIGTLGGGGSLPTDINDSGQVLGYSAPPNGDWHAFLYSNGNMQDIGALVNPEMGSRAGGINNKRQAVGWLMDRNGNSSSAFLYLEGSIELLDMEISASNPKDVNDLGELVGFIFDEYRYRAYLYSGDSVKYLGTLGGLSSSAVAINNNGEIVGSADTSNHTAHPFLYQNDTMKDLGVLTDLRSGSASGLNNQGQVVGIATTSNNVEYAFLYADGVMYNLNNLTVNAAGWTLRWAYGINDAGQIVGEAITEFGRSQAFLLNPLPLGWRETIESAQPRPTYGEAPVKEKGRDGLILVTHGLIPSGDLPEESTAWIHTMTNVIGSYVTGQGKTNWQLCAFPWFEGAQANFVQGVENAKEQGFKLGSCLATQNWSNIHFIAHSAGSALIQEATEVIKNNAPNVTTQCTFLDAYIGINRAGVSDYGHNANWSDSYFCFDLDTYENVERYTSGAFSNAYNVDVSFLDPNSVIIPHYTGLNDVYCTNSAISSHGWPIDFYLTTALMSWPEAEGLGFPLSMEAAGNWSSVTNQYTVGNDPPYPLGASDYPCEPYFQAQYEAPWWVNFLQSTTLDSESGTSEKGTNSLLLIPGSPVWSAAVVTLTNAYNVVSFDAVFYHTNGSDGLLSVHWDTETIGTVNERAILEGLQHYTFQFPTAPANNSHVLGFRLDPYTNAPASVLITNVVLSQAGVTEPFSLSVTTNTYQGLRVFELYGQPGFSYTLESSTNLIDWEPQAILVSTNGTVPFVDPEEPNHGYRFYRAVAPY